MVRRSLHMMGTDLTLRLPDRPGSMAELCERFASAGVVVDGICGLVEEGIDVDHLLVRDADTARAVSESAGAEIVRMRDVLVLDDARDVETLAAVTRRIADAGVGIDLIYLTTDGRVVLGVDDPALAASALAL